MNHIMFFPAYHEHVVSSTGLLAAIPPGGEHAGVEIGRADVQTVRLLQSGEAPLVFEGRLLVDETLGGYALSLYDTADGEFVSVFGKAGFLDVPSRRILVQGTGEVVAETLNDIDLARLVDANIPEGLSSLEVVQLIESRLSEASSALLGLSAILNIDASDAMTRLAVLCDGEKTWLQ